MMNKRLGWSTPPGIGTTSGYGKVAVELIRALQLKDVWVGWSAEEPRVSVSFSQPEWYGGNEYQYRIGYTPWESTEIPEMWPIYMNQMDEIWTTSTFCQDIFKKAGVESKILPHGINPEIYSIVDRTRTDKFVFLHVGGGVARKGASMVTKAFIELFDDKEDVFLLMKSNGPSEARWVDKKGYYRGNINNHPRVQVVEQELDEYDLAKMYHVAHCMVYPTCGEGWGLPGWEAISTGLPTIVTNLTGPADYAHYSMPLKADWGPGVGVHLGNWAVPDYDNLLELMSDAYENWEEHKQKAMHSARIIHNTQTWSHVADKLLDFVGDKITESAQEYVN